jgi:hypothetical protein
MLYNWENSSIKFLEKFKMDAFGEGSYEFIDNQNITANFGGRVHNITLTTIIQNLHLLEKMIRKL